MDIDGNMTKIYECANQLKNNETACCKIYISCVKLACTITTAKSIKNISFVLEGDDYEKGMITMKLNN